MGSPLAIEVRERVGKWGKLTIKVDEGAILNSFVASHGPLRERYTLFGVGKVVLLKSSEVVEAYLAQNDRGVIGTVAIKTSRAI